MDNLIVVDRIHHIPDDFTPNLSECYGVRLDSEAACACEKMLEAAREEGVFIKPLSGYRGVEYQQELWRMDISRYLSQGLDTVQAQALTSRYLAKPGCSEHHTGLACDFCSPDWDDTQDDFHMTAQGRWLSKNAHRFGFILRYPRMKEHITGISYEPWHYRYVGKNHAEIIYAQSLTLEEYLYYYFLWYV